MGGGGKGEGEDLLYHLTNPGSIWRTSSRMKGGGGSKPVSYYSNTTHTSNLTPHTRYVCSKCSVWGDVDRWVSYPWGHGRLPLCKLYDLDVEDFLSLLVYRLVLCTDDDDGGYIYIPTSGA